MLRGTSEIYWYARSVGKERGGARDALSRGCHGGGVPPVNFMLQDRNREWEDVETSFP